MSTAIRSTFRWHCAAPEYETPCAACDGTDTRWISSDEEGDVWTCACGFEFKVMVDDIEPTTVYLVGRAVFTEYGMAQQYAEQCATGSNQVSIETIDLYNDIY